MRLKKIVYIILGCLSVGLGGVGVVLPLLPAFPFLLLAAICFGKSSRSLDQWFTGTTLYKQNFENYVKGKGMTKKTKFRVITMVTIFMSLGFILMDGVPAGRILLLCAWLLHILYFCFRVKTLKTSMILEG